MHRWFDPLADVLFRPFCKSPEKGAIPAVNALLYKSTDNGQQSADLVQKNVKLFSGNKSKLISQKHYDNPMRKWLWEETEMQLIVWN